VTVNDCVNDAAGRLVTAGFSPDEARRDASVLARHVLGWSLTEWAAGLREPAPPALSERLLTAVGRRARREPVAYITGVREFYGREFHVTPAVLIPRPETEGLVEQAIMAIAAGAARWPAPVVVDVGTGSGCVAITIALAHAHARVIATDVSAAALDVARLNAQRLGATVEFVETSLLPEVPATFDFIVSNPPYISTADRASLAPDVRDFEPEQALFADENGLAVIRALASAARARLTSGGFLLMEIGHGQAADVISELRAAGLDVGHIAPDLQGIDRVVVARQQPSGSSA